MNNRTASNKIMPLAEAVQMYVTAGCHISVGGFTVNRNPMAAVHEIIRQKITGLHLYAHSNGQAVDELIGGGCVGRLEIAYGGNGLFAATCIRFRKAVERGEVVVEDYSNFQMALRFLAGAMGVPFLPTRSGLGSDIVAKWGFDAAARLADPRLPDKKLAVIDNPFGAFGNMEKVVLAPAITPDVTIIHAQQAEACGTARINGLTFADVEQVKAARRVIVTCEEVLANGALRDRPDHNQIPPFCVDAVVPVRMGAYPTACYGCYDYDPVFLRQYGAAAKDDRQFEAYLKTYIHNIADREAFLSLLPPEQLAAVKADPRTGYAADLKR